MYNNIFLNNLDKFKLNLNAKTPCVLWKNKHNHKKNISFKYNNVGIPCGKENNLIVVDVDNKDEGIEEFDNYINLFGKPKTLIVKSINGGYHYYFTYKHSTESASYLITNNLKNSTKYRNKGIDIRTTGGYIVAPNSTVDKKKYTVVNDIEPIEIPESLLIWLLEGKTTINNNNEDNKNKNKNGDNKKIKDQPIFKYKNSVFMNKYHYDITDEKILEILNKLDSSWYIAFDKWLIVLTVLKNLNKYDIFEIFSKKGKNYDYETNLKLWNYNTGCIDINYLIIKINQEQLLNLPLIEKCKILPENTMYKNIKNISLNKKHLVIDDDIFDNFDTLIIKSDTGTGKTTHTGKQLERYFKYVGTKYQFVSIVNLINLAKQQLKTFKDNNIEIKSYKDDDVDFVEGNFIICINSLKILEGLDDDYFNNKIIYIDEITSFLEGLTHNDNLNNYIKTTYELLIKLLKKAHKIIATDATIMDNVFDFFKFRDNDKKIYINNEFQKYKSIEAIRVKDENLFLKKIKDHIEQNKYFLFGCDSCETITKIYLKFEKDYPDKVKNMILITSDQKFDIKDANDDFLNKWVFYSPSIVTGVDFSVKTKQDQFIYIKGNSISPVSIYQQSTRNRNIDKLYYYVESKNIKDKYNSLDEVKSNYKKLIEINKNINDVCKQFDENEDVYINENMYFNLFCYNEYIFDVYNTNKRLHYEHILKNKGFILKSEGETVKISAKTKKNMNDLYKEQDLVSEYLKDTSEDKRKKTKYQELISLINIFKLENDKSILKYKSILNDKFERQHFFNFIKLFHNDTGEKKVNKHSFEIKNIMHIDEKIKVIKKLYSDHNIKYLSLDEFQTVKKINITDENFLYIKKLFRSEKEKPTDSTGLKYLIVGALKNLIGKLKIINMVQDKLKNNVSVYNYSFDDEKIKFYNELFKKIKKNEVY
jgi:hypothetical protein